MVRRCGHPGERSDWDSNPGESFEAPYTLSRRAPSTTRTSLPRAAGILAWAAIGVNEKAALGQGERIFLGGILRERIAYRRELLLLPEFPDGFALSDRAFRRPARPAGGTDPSSRPLRYPDHRAVRHDLRCRRLRQHAGVGPGPRGMAARAIVPGGRDPLA